MNTTSKMLLILLLAAATSLGAAFRSDASAQTEGQRGRLELERTSYTVKAWQSDGSHLAAVKGKLTYGERPVARALVQVGTQGRSISTREDGSFELSVDRSLIALKSVRVISVHDAAIDGKPIEEEEARSIRSASSSIRVCHPIEVSKVVPSDADASQVKVHARFMIDKGDKISFFQASKYRISGQVLDADGNAVRDAIVWIDRDGGEGFAKSTPTDRNGTYEMFYWPEEEDTNLTVIVGSRRFTLPEGKVFRLPRNTSVNIRIRLPKNGSVINDKPPDLVCTTMKGATYTGLLAGLDVPTGTPYFTTIPDRQGRFVVTVPRDVWATHPPFFETMLTKFVEREKILKAGDELPVDFALPGDQDPKWHVAAPGMSGAE